MLTWPTGTADCRVVAAAGAFVLLRPVRSEGLSAGNPGACSLTFLDGMIPMGWDGNAVWAGEPGELRFRVDPGEREADRRSSVRLPIFAEVMVASEGAEMRGQILDVSAGGMRFRGTGRHERGATLRIHTQLPNGPVIDAYGVVRLAEPGGVTAIEFTDFKVGSAQEVGAWTVAQLRRAIAAQG